MAKKIKNYYVNVKKIEKFEDDKIQRPLLFMKQKYGQHRVKTQQRSQLIPHIRDENGNIKISSNNIAEVFHSFYSKLYVSSTPDKEVIELFLKKN